MTDYGTVNKQSEKENKKAVTLTLLPSTMELANKAAKLANMSRSAYIEKLILENTDLNKLLKKFMSDSGIDSNGCEKIPRRLTMTPNKEGV